ncbi:hypothetical protein SB5544_01504 [Klebsiella variicola]|nr:hypothetical protein [Klebsiella variicola]VGP80576.1 hypothetical protein SB5544_01504 [Klebsiella variicola]
MMNVKPIRTEQDYEAALSAVELFLIMSQRLIRRLHAQFGIPLESLIGA